MPEAYKVEHHIGAPVIDLNKLFFSTVEEFVVFIVEGGIRKSIVMLYPIIKNYRLKTL